jgi:hypothetical protein
VEAASRQLNRRRVRKKETQLRTREYVAKVGRTGGRARREGRGRGEGGGTAGWQEEEEEEEEALTPRPKPTLNSLIYCQFKPNVHYVDGSAYTLNNSPGNFRVLYLIFCGFWIPRQIRKAFMRLNALHFILGVFRPVVVEWLCE